MRGRWIQDEDWLRERKDGCSRGRLAALIPNEAISFRTQNPYLNNNL